ncbi:MAG: hypothetical protein E6Q97_32875 [Desulfurellales bacterium]|nr:MAG: hypothetical protein E6Q97_32875 [Desulfurellales bacterium]
MSTATQLTRLQAIRDGLYDTSTYREDNSLTKALQFIGWINRAVTLLPRSGTFGGGAGEQVQFDLQTLAAQKEDAMKFVAMKRGSAGGDLQLSFECFWE